MWTGNFFHTANYLFQNSSRQGNPYAKIFLDNDTHMFYLVWMKKNVPDTKNFHVAMLQEVLAEQSSK
jgi:hypothetical protein